jgi:pentatricopeptide repeat protein
MLRISRTLFPRFIYITIRPFSTTPKCYNHELVSSLKNSLIEASRLKDAKRSQQIFNKLKQETKLDETMYAALIQAYFNIREVEKAIDVCNQMISNSIEPTIITLKTMVRGFAKNGQVEQARTILNNVIQQDIDDEASLAIMYNVMINGFALKNKKQKSIEYFHKMKKAGLIPDKSTLKILKLHQLKQACSDCSCID